MNKKSVLVLSALCIEILSGCAATSEIPVNPAGLVYKEISASELLSSKENFNNYFSKQDAACKVTNVWIEKSGTENTADASEFFFVLTCRTDGRSYDEYKVYSTDFVNAMNKIDPEWIDRMNAVSQNTKYNGQYTVFLYSKQTGNWLNGYTTQVILENMDGIPTAEQLEADAAAEEKARAEKEAYEVKLQEKENAGLDAKGREIAKGCTYHGINESVKNAKLFNNKCLKEGHAYYIPALLFSAYLGGDYAQAVESLFDEGTVQRVDYISQDVRETVLENAKFFGQYLPVAVVVAGGKGRTKTPIILGLVDSKENTGD